MTRILLVEDHEEIWDFLSRRLRRRGHEVLLAMDGEAAVEMARRERPDIVLLDMNLPVMDGWTAAGLIKAGAPPGRNRVSSSRLKATGSSQNDQLFMRGRAMSGAPICSGIIQLPRPTKAGMTPPKIITSA